jgi:hypothetical protein
MIIAQSKVGCHRFIRDEYRILPLSSDYKLKKDVLIKEQIYVF